MSSPNPASNSTGTSTRSSNNNSISPSLTNNIAQPIDNAESNFEDLELHSPWSLFFEHPTLERNSWSKTNIEEVSRFTTLGEAICVLDSIRPPHQLELKNRVHIMRANVRPVFEDPKNKSGETIVFRFTPKSAEGFESIWRNFVFSLIGERIGSCVGIENRREILGMTVCTRSENRVQEYQQLSNNKPKPQSITKMELKIWRRNTNVQYRGLIVKFCKSLIDEELISDEIIDFDVDHASSLVADSKRTRGPSRNQPSRNNRRNNRRRHNNNNYNNNNKN
ncbi:hypothetical protein PCE1_003055 [Barthelona sp. PCE]